MKQFLLFIFILCGLNTHGSDYYELNKRLVLAQEEISKLKLKTAESLIHEEIKQNPENLASYYYLNYIECYKVLIGQNKSEYLNFKSNVEERIERFTNWKSNSNEKQVALTQLELHLGFTKILYNEYIGAALNFRSSFKISKALYEKEPTLLINQKNYGLLYASIGTFPEQYKWVLRSIGLEGDFNDGIKILGDFIEKSSTKSELNTEHSEALFAYSYLLLNFGKSKKATWEFVKKHTLNYTDNIAFCYLRALTAEKCYQSEECIKVISKKPSGLEFEQISLFDYLMGSAKLNLLEMDADIWLKKFVSFSSSNFQKKDAYRKLSWHSLLNGNNDKFKIYRNLSLKFQSNSLEEQLVSRDLDKNIYPNKTLIKARLLFDGGLFKKSLQLCFLLQAPEIKSTYQQIELEYRLARNYQELENEVKAKIYFKRCLEIPNPPQTYLLPNACLQLAYIYEKSSDVKQAKIYYNKVLCYKNYEYKQSIYQEAKNGLYNLK